MLDDDAAPEDTEINKPPDTDVREADAEAPANEENENNDTEEAPG